MLNMDKSLLITRAKITKIELSESDCGLKEIIGSVTIDFVSTGDFSVYVDENDNVTERLKQEIISKLMKPVYVDQYRKSM